jgi:hypothetical protein
MKCLPSRKRVQTRYKHEYIKAADGNRASLLSFSLRIIPNDVLVFFVFAMKSALVSLAIYATVALGQALTINTPYVLFRICANILRQLINPNTVAVSLCVSLLSSAGVEELVRVCSCCCRRALTDCAFTRPLYCGSFTNRFDLILLIRRRVTSSLQR